MRIFNNSKLQTSVRSARGFSSRGVRGGAAAFVRGAVWVYATTEPAAMATSGVCLWKHRHLSSVSVVLADIAEP